jgi:hypothetical protein
MFEWVGVEVICMLQRAVAQVCARLGSSGGGWLLAVAIHLPTRTTALPCLHADGSRMQGVLPCALLHAHQPTTSDMRSSLCLLHHALSTPLLVCCQCRAGRGSLTDAPFLVFMQQYVRSQPTPLQPCSPRGWAPEVARRPAFVTNARKLMWCKHGHASMTLVT